MRARTAFVVVLALACTLVAAQEEIAGSWQGDKALGDVHITSDGTGAITFLHDPNLTMEIKIEKRGSTYVVSQDEPNRDAFYTGVFDIAIARVLTDEARPMVWEFTLSSDGERLSGTKYTTFVEYRGGPQPQVISIDNDYERPAEWKRLSGRVATPAVAPEPESVSLPVSVQLRTTTPNASILYTVDGEPPTRETATVYDGPIHLDDTTTVRAIAVRDGWQDSALFEAVYTKSHAQGDGLSIRTPRVMAVGERQEWYHVNDTNYTSLYYTATVRANTLYEFRIWDELDDGSRYSSQFELVDIYWDPDKDEKQIFQTRAHNKHEIYTSRAGRIYIQIRNRYYEGFGEMAMRLRAK